MKQFKIYREYQEYAGLMRNSDLRLLFDHVTDDELDLLKSELARLKSWTQIVFNKMQHEISCFRELSFGKLEVYCNVESLVILEELPF